VTSALALIVEAAEARSTLLSDVTLARPPQCARSSTLPCRRIEKEHHMHATIRRYDGVDVTRVDEVVKITSGDVVAHSASATA
jgi:hypothetical protein